MIAGSKNKGAGSEDSLSFKVIQYLFEHPEVYIGLSALAVVIANSYIVFKNQKIKYIAEIARNENSIQLEIVNLYYTKRQVAEIPTVDFEFYVENSTTNSNEKRQKIIFRDKLNNKTVGEINPKHFFWSDHLIQLRTVIQELKEYRKMNLTKHNDSLEFGTFLKRN
jgi:hypothetical protein